jgi:hypothetical protein
LLLPNRTFCPWRGRTAIVTRLFSWRGRTRYLTRVASTIRGWTSSTFSGRIATFRRRTTAFRRTIVTTLRWGVTTLRWRITTLNRRVNAFRWRVATFRWWTTAFRRDRRIRAATRTLVPHLELLTFRAPGNLLDSHRPRQIAPKRRRNNLSACNHRRVLKLLRDSRRNVLLATPPR